MRKNIFESEEEARECLNTCKGDMNWSSKTGVCIDATIEYWKQAGLIRPNAYEELMEYVEKIICVSTKDMDKDNSGLKHLIQAYHDEKHSLSPAVKEAREKTFNALFDYIIRILSTIPGVDTDKLNQLVQDVIQSERNAADKE